MKIGIEKLRNLRFVTIILVIISGIIYYPRLPETIPAHWNIKGEVDSYSPKLYGIGIILIILVSMNLIFEFLPKIDPKGKNYKLFRREWESITLSITLFLTFIYATVIYSGLHQGVNTSTLIIVAMGVLFVLLGVNMRKIKQNYFMGIRTPWTISNEKNWTVTHVFASKVYVIGGVVAVLGTLFQINSVVVFLLILSLALSPVIYSLLYFLLHRKE